MSVIKVKNNQGEFEDIATIQGTQGEQGIQGEIGPAGQGIPTGGEEGQILVKSSDANYDTEWADQYKVGDIFVTPEGESPTYPGSYSLVSQIAGGGLIAYGYSYGNEATTQVAQNTLIKYSDNTIPKTAYSIENYVDGVLSFDSGTFRCHPSGIVGMVEANLIISGHCTLNTGGIWTKGSGNELPSGVSCNMDGSYPLFNIGSANGYGGCSYSILYQVEPNSDSFYINPSFAPYMCNFTPGGGGVGCSLTVRVYAKKGILLDVWKKTR